MSIVPVFGVCLIVSILFLIGAPLSLKNLIMLLWVFLIVCVVIAGYKAANMVGSFDRILREMDQVIDGSEKKPLTSRKDDELTQQLLRRINVLINGYQRDTEPVND
jgi:hypothetical protein